MTLENLGLLQYTFFSFLKHSSMRAVRKSVEFDAGFSMLNIKAISMFCIDFYLLAVTSPAIASFI